MRNLLVCSFLFTIFSAFTPVSSELKSVKGLPLKSSPSKGPNDQLVIYLTGDGGWNSFSEKLTQAIENKGYGVVTLNTRKYFWSKKTPDIFARDIEQISNSYMNEWNKSSVIIVGYSFGADVAAFLPGRLTSAFLAKTKYVALLSPSLSSDFVINLRDLIGDSKSRKRKYKLEPELDNPNLPVVCIFGKSEDLYLKKLLSKNDKLTVHELPGGHHYQNNMKLIVQTIGL